MGWTADTEHRGITAAATRRGVSASERGFTLVEVTTSVAVLLVVLTAAWLLSQSPTTTSTASKAADRLPR